MRILLINSVCGIRSTGRICVELAERFEKEGHKVKIAYGREGFVPKEYEKYAVRIGCDLDIKLHAIRTRVLDEHGFGSVKATKEFLKWADEFDPDIVWLHNIHGYYINVELLFAWIKKRPNMQIKWTLHDCWAFTGHCAHFVAVNCEQWKEQCLICCDKNAYPTSRWKDNCKSNFIRKKNAFTGVNNLTLITPSKWLADLTRESFLKEYPVEVQYNKIDTSIFKPTQSDFREENRIEDKRVILGVASTWTERKGIFDFIKLSKMLGNKYAIVLVGISQNDFMLVKTGKLEEQSLKKKVGQPKEIIRESGGVVIPQDVNILYQVIAEEYKEEKEEKIGSAEVICIPRTNDRIELAKIYTAADLFVNPTYEDTYPTVNLEARSCGTKVITYNTGGCIETLM